MRFFLRLLVLMSVALLPLTSFAARAGTAADLTSSGVEFEQFALPKPTERATPALEHRHSTLWAAEAGERPVPMADVFVESSGTRRSCSDAGGAALFGPQAPTPPPKA